MEIEFTVLIIGLPVLLSAWATTKVMADEFSERGQKRAQLVLVWLLPVIGALLVLAVHRKPDEPSRQYRKDTDPGDDFGASRAAYRKTLDVLDGD